MTSEGLGDVFEGDSADTCGGKCWLMLMGGASGGSRVRSPGCERKFLFFSISSNTTFFTTEGFYNNHSKA